MAAEIRHDVELPFPIERVWKALTDTDELGRWFSTSTMKPVAGNRFRLLDPANPHWDGIRRCEVLEIVPPRRLVYSWQMGDDAPHRVEWTLVPTPSGTRLSLRHSGFAPEWPLRAMVEQGYATLLPRLEAFLRTGQAQRAAYAPTPAQLREP